MALVEAPAQGIRRHHAAHAAAQDENPLSAHCVSFVKS
jgi:hypothetical protein